MSELNADATIDDILNRLTARFPTVERERVEVVVGEEQARLADARVRDFIPVLVEHESLKRLRKEATATLPPVDEVAARAAAGPGGQQPELDPLEVERRNAPPSLLLGDLGGGPG
ncbi:three-helix bundle dimerization domain-containing protein [Agromyces sp. NPDC058136]|uniref:three-helix bundle dimerization domain-containing protein n=1 Tax=Agromyces sp. NPDC058136 TaxID=3346354 RepID=UPI0036DDD729